MQENMHDALKMIIEAKRRGVELLKKNETEVKALAAKASKPLSLYKSLSHDGRLSIIAEIKHASPSEGVIRSDFDHLEILKIYEEMGADAISVLTEEEYFLGKLKYLQEVKAASKLPILRKDFIIDEIQVYHSRALGADAILLIAGILPIERLAQLKKLANDLGMEALIEVHTLKELKSVLDLNPRIVGINNRDLTTFKVDVTTAQKLAPLVSEDTVVVCESGIHTPKDVLLMKGSNVDALLIGTAFMKAPDMRAKFAEIKAACDE
jgi:indole-3-glycerol phosphate synthase